MGAGKELWTEFVERFCKKDWAGVASFFTTDAVLIDPTGRYEGREAIQTYVEAADEPFSDGRMETSRVIEEGDTVVAEWTGWATNTGQLAMPDGTKTPATGRTIEIAGVSIVTIKDGKFATERDYFDNAALMTQLGLMPGT
jgi:ketosteroid isomerase-like protein